MALKVRSLFVASLLLLSAVGCGDDRGRPGLGDGGSCVPEGEVEHPHDSTPAMHVASLEGVMFDYTNPPSSGPHCPTWGAYAVYGPERPLARCNYLHNLEHGAVVLVYNCPAGCPEIQSALAWMVDKGPSDPDCPWRRLVVTPDPDLEVKVAAAAWGYTWRSDCLDDAAFDSLTEFVSAHLGTRGDAPEPTVCAIGAL